MIVKKGRRCGSINLLDSNVDTAYYVVPLRLDGGSVFHGDTTEQQQSA